MFDRVLAISEGLPDRTAPEFEGVRAVYTFVMGSVYHVAQRLIDAKQRGRAPNGPDEALIVLCNRLYNESFAGYVVLSPRATRGWPAPHSSSDRDSESRVPVPAEARLHGSLAEWEAILAWPRAGTARRA